MKINAETLAYIQFIPYLCITKENKLKSNRIMEKKLLVFVKTLIGYSVISIPMMLNILEKYIPYIVCTIEEAGDNTLTLKMNFESFIMTFGIIVERRERNNYYVKDIVV